MKLLFRFVTSILAPLLITAPIRAADQPAEPPQSSQIHISVVDRDAGSSEAGSRSDKGFTVLVADSAGAPVSESAVVFRLPDEGPGGSFADLSHSAIVYTSANGLAKISGIKWSDAPGPVAIKVTATKGDARAGILMMETLTPKDAPAAAGSAPAPTMSPTSKSPVEAPVPQVTSAAVQPGLPDRQAKAPLPRTSETPQSVGAPPSVSVVSNKTADTGYHSSHKKWIILAAVAAAAAGAGVAVGAKGKSSAKTSTSGVSVGTPSVSVGQP